MKITSVFESEHLRIGTANSLFIVVYAGPTTADTMAIVDREEGRFIAERGKISLLSVVVQSGGTVDRISEEVRAAALEMVARYQHHVTADAVVVPARGIVAAIIRTFLVGFSLISRRPYPSRVFSQLDEAIAWLKQVPGQDQAFADSASDEPGVNEFMG
jgi:hypothetical protein